MLPHGTAVRRSSATMWRADTNTSTFCLPLLPEHFHSTAECIAIRPCRLSKVVMKHTQANCVLLRECCTVDQERRPRRCSRKSGKRNEVSESSFRTQAMASYCFIIHNAASNQKEMEEMRSSNEVCVISAKRKAGEAQPVGPQCHSSVTRVSRQDKSRNALKAWYTGDLAISLKV